MKYIDFERVISQERLRRYLIACNNNTRKAVLLYRYNLKISKEMFLIISCFEVALRNKIDNEMYSHSGKCLLGIFPNKSKSSTTTQYNNTYVFNELDKINILMNRIAHHEPICFNKPANIDTSKIKNCYDSIMALFSWMNINHRNLFYGLDHIADLLEKFKNF